MLSYSVHHFTPFIVSADGHFGCKADAVVYRFGFHICMCNGMSIAILHANHCLWGSHIAVWVLLIQVWACTLSDSHFPFLSSLPPPSPSSLPSCSLHFFPCICLLSSLYNAPAPPVLTPGLPSDLQGLLSYSFFTT